MAYFTIAAVLGQFDDALKTSTLLNDIIIGLWGLSDIVLIYSIKTKKHIIFGMWILINVSQTSISKSFKILEFFMKDKLIHVRLFSKSKEDLNP